jgi:transposase
MVSVGVVQRALHQYRLTGDLTPKKSGGAPPSKLAGHDEFTLSM